MANFKENQLKVARARAVLAAAEKRLYSAKIGYTRKLNDQSVLNLQRQLSAEFGRVKVAREKLSAAIDNLYRTHRFEDAIGQLDSKVPVLMLPLRIETRIVDNNNQSELWLRVYPDDIHVHNHEPVLTEKEYQYGIYYWKSLAVANREAGGKAETKKQNAWQDLSKRTGIQRALWIAKSTIPANWHPNYTADENLLNFNEPELKDHDWTMAPRTNILPDKFAVSILKNNKVLSTHIGNTIPDTLYLGPDPYLAEEAFKKGDKNIEIHESFAWTTDFNKAVKNGMGFKIPLTNAHFNRGRIDQIVIMGVMATASPVESKEMIETLFESQHFSAKGFSFLPQRSPTNNTAENKSSYRPNEDYLPKGYYDGTTIQDLKNLPNAEGNNFAEYLGINSDIFDEVNNASMVEQFEASAMNKALYPATAGNFLEVYCNPMLNDTSQKQIRDFFNHFVTAGGPLPSFRVGDQPYGTLVTSNLGQWEEKDTFYKGLTDTFKKLQSEFDQITIQKVVHTGRPGDPSEIMMDIFGLNAGSKSFYQRMAYLADLVSTQTKLTKARKGLAAKQQEVLAFLKRMGYSNTSNPTITSLAFKDVTNVIAFKNHVNGKMPSTKEFLEQIGDSGKNYIEWLATVKSLSSLQNQKMGGPAPPFILYLLMRHALLEEIKKSTEEFYLRQKVSYQRAAFDKSFYNFDRNVNDITEFEILNGVPAKVSSQKFNIRQPVGDYLLNNGGTGIEAARLREMRAAMQVLAPLPTSKLHRYLRDHLDLVSYRLDAWQNGLFFKRLLENRELKPNGLYLGAFGWVENLRKSKKTEALNIPAELKPLNNAKVYKQEGSAGFVHAPSLNHATTAGVLLAGYQNHASKSDPSPFAINLSSERIRKATMILQGIQQQQSLEVLLGYQFERALHDITTANPVNNLNRYVFGLRQKFPVESNSIPQDGTEAQEVVSPYPVVNGLSLTKASQAEIKAVVTKPQDVPLVMKEIDRLKDTLDAVNDLLVSEAVHQATQGKKDRVVGLLNALKYSELPPELEVAQTPRTSQSGITNRISLHFNLKKNVKNNPGWTAEDSPRKSAEPGLNEWLERMLGDPRRIVAEAAEITKNETVRNKRKIKLSDLKINAIDLVFICGEDIQQSAKELESKIYDHYTSLINIAADSRVIVIFEPEQTSAKERSLVSVLPLIRNLRVLIGSARIASARDFQPRTNTVLQNPDDEFGWDIIELKKRVDNLLSRFNSFFVNALNIKLIDNPAGDHPEWSHQLLLKYNENGKSPDYLKTVPLKNKACKDIVEFLKSVYLFGLKISVPTTTDPENNMERKDLLTIFISTMEALGSRQQEVNKLLIDYANESSLKLKVRILQQAAKCITGDDFVIIPNFKFSNPDDVSASLNQNSKNDLLKFYRDKNGMDDSGVINEWLDSVGAVRKQVRFLNDSNLISEVQTANYHEFVPVQLPFAENDFWLAVEFPEVDPRTQLPFDIDKDTICLAIQGEQAYETKDKQSALILDEWTEFIPNRKEITGISYNYNQPNATAPNTLLLAVEPTGSDNWSLEALINTITDTFRRAKSRAVEPNQLLEHKGLDQLSPMTVASFDLNQLNVSLDYLVAEPKFLQSMKNTGNQLYKNFKIIKD